MLMRDHLEADRADMESMPADDIVGQSALLWRMIYRTVHATLRHGERKSNRQGDARELIPTIEVVRHEDLSLDPVAGYKSLYDSLSSSENPTELSKKKVHSVKLDSRANMSNWKKRLTPEEITRIRKLTEDVSHLFYSDTEWE